MQQPAMPNEPSSHNPLPSSGEDDEEIWRPEAKNLQGEWQTGRPYVFSHLLPPLQAEVGMTALAGQVLRLNDQPLEGVTLRIGDQVALTDEAGRFLLAPIPSGHQELLIDGRTASQVGYTYGVFEAGVEVAAGLTNVLLFTIWMPRINTAHAVTIPSPTTAEVVVTTPAIPGLEVHIPAGTIIRDQDGQAVTQVSITAIPVDRPPFPLPSDVEVPIYFTVQPGGAYIEPYGVQIIYPNYMSGLPGTRVNFWNYDPGTKGWYIYGQGTVTPDGKQIVPDPDVAVYELTGAMITEGHSPPDLAAIFGGLIGGEPVDLGTGLFVLEKTDLFLPDVLPIALTRTYRSKDPDGSRPFGIGTTHPYEMFLFSAREYQEADLILPDGGRVHYVRISPGIGFRDAVFEHTATPTVFYKSRLQWNGHGWDLIRKDGTVYVFGENAPLQAIRDRYGNTITITRANGLGGNITQIRSPNGRWIEFTYDGLNHITQARDNSGRVVTYAYDSFAAGRLVRVTDPNGGVTEYTYDLLSHRMLTITDARGIVFLTNQYDTATGRVVRQTLADGSTYQLAYTVDGNGKITQTNVTDPRGNVRRVTINASGYMLTDTQALGTPEQQTTTYERQEGTNLALSMTDSLGRKAAYTYDTAGNLTSVTKLAETPEAVITSITYEPSFHQVTSRTDPLGHTTTAAYDDKGNPVTVTDPLGNRTTLTYNTVGQLISTTDPLGNVTQFAYELGDFIGTTDALSQSTARVFDDAGRLVGLTNSQNQTIQVEYDVLDRLTRMTDPLGGVKVFTYDPNGNFLDMTDARGNVTSYTYDLMDRLRSRTDPLMRVSRYQYDAVGNLTQSTDRKAQVTQFSYNTLNRLSRIMYADGSTITYTYDAANRLRQVEDSVSGTITRTYDGLDRLVSETTPQGTVTYTYDVAGRRTGMTVAGQPTVIYTYDNADRLTQISQGTSSVSMNYDALGRRTALTLPNSIVVSYVYDTASQLINLTYQRGATRLGELTYTYDDRGNRTRIGGSFARTGMPTAVNSATYDTANQLTTRGASTLTHDANGNLINDGVQSYTWDVRNRLIAITGPGLTASFTYDAFGRRIKKIINGVETSYLYDSLTPVQELSNGMPTANLLTGLSRDEYFTRTDATGTHTLLPDSLGSTLAIVDTSGLVETQYIYDPFGGTTATVGSSSNSFEFTGREQDGTGLYYYRARYYSPTFQRFISEDPLWNCRGDINLYTYVRNSPTNFTDPTGLVIGGRKGGDGDLGALGLGIGGLLSALGISLPGRQALAEAIVVLAEVAPEILVIVAVAGLIAAIILAEEAAREEEWYQRCQEYYIACAANRRQPEWNREDYGDLKPCADCLQACVRTKGQWPWSICPP
jgi:RHS repeat-associated protein